MEDDKHIKFRQATTGGMSIGMTVEEIAKELGVSVKYVRYHERKALNKMKKLYLTLGWTPELILGGRR